MVTKIGKSAFAACSSLTSITIPSSVVSIDNFAFAGCEFEEINVSWTNPNTVANGGIMSYGNGIFASVPTSCVVNIPEGLLADYKIYPWMYFDNVNATPTSLYNTKTTEVKIYSQSHNIIIANANADAPVKIYNVSGNLVAQGEKTEFAMKQAGIYIVKVGAIVQKIIVK
jgi:hypothetical protein